jgi:hypothetical protein
VLSSSSNHGWTEVLDNITKCYESKAEMSMADEDDMSDYDYSEDKFVLSNAIEVAPSTV